MEERKVEKVTLGGRDFLTLADVTTIERDYWLMGKIRMAGLGVVHINSGESADDFVTRLLQDAMNSGEVFNMLGGVLLPAHMKPEAWTPEVATETATFIKQLTADEDKAKVRQLVVSLLMSFFVQGLASLTISRKFSEGNATASPAGSAGNTTTETGTSL